VQQLVECGQVGITGDRGQGGRGRIGQSQDGLYPDNRTLRSRIHASTLDPARIQKMILGCNVLAPTWMEAW
jgi:hypothetical protein